MNSNEGIFYVKLTQKEALQAKKDILANQISLLKTSRTIKNYSSLRNQEIILRIKLENYLKEFSTLVEKLQKVTPKIKIPEILQKRLHQNQTLNEIEKEEVKKITIENDLEKELKEIQDRLDALAKK
jgi:phosphoribosylaminoimidazole carboxylase (NCAIR synthetase)